MIKRKLMVLLALVLVLSGCSGKQPNNTDKPHDNTVVTSENRVSSISVEDTLARLTLDQKAAQMVQGAVYNVSDDVMKKNCYGSILSTYGEKSLNASEWKSLILRYQKDAISSDAGIPYLYGNDAVHGVNTCEGTVIFPHNIGIGAANDPELTYQMGLAVANEAKLTGMLWSFSPCLAAAQDPRWGRTYESYSSQTDIVTKLGTSFAKGLIDGGLLPCAKHFLQMVMFCTEPVKHWIGKKG